MAGRIDAKVVSPDTSLFEGGIEACFARSVAGEIGLLPGHQPALLLLAPAPLRLRLEDGSFRTFAVRSGFLEFSANQLTVLADAAEQVDSVEAAWAALEADRQP